MERLFIITIGAGALYKLGKLPIVSDRKLIGPHNIQSATKGQRKMKLNNKKSSAETGS